MNLNGLDKEAIEESKRNPKRNVSIISLRNSNKDIFLVRTRKLPEKWQPIGGGISIGESEEEAILRETYEEVGILLDKSKIKKVIEVPYDFGDGIIHCYDTIEETNDYLMSINKDEIVEYKWIPVNEALKLQMYDATKKFIEALININ